LLFFSVSFVNSRPGAKVSIFRIIAVLDFFLLYYKIKRLLKLLILQMRALLGI